MKRRIRKKIAKRFLNGEKISRYALGRRDYYPNAYTVVTYIVFPEKLLDEIRRQAARRGWDGCHWSDPTVIEIYNFDTDQTETRYDGKWSR